MALAALGSSLAMADPIIAYTSVFPATATDVTDVPIAITPFQDGVNGVPLDAVLQSFTITYNESIIGSISVSNTGTNSTIGATVDSLGLLYAFTSTPAGDLPINPASPPSDDVFGGAGPDPFFHTTAALTHNQTAGPFNYNKSASAISGIINDSTSLTDAQSAWNVYLDSATNVSTSATGSGVGGATYANTVAGTVTVTYDYIEESAIPEPATLVLFGSALIGLGLLRKRKSS
jgi:hypothetical protein